ncbi:peptidoglycan binding domain-containing protein [Aerococcaceae bacterium zg-B36]|uniref:L,D-transpeptidase family protein n=1 Tax=Aerococcaceae bacterium zg-252 TaxID=2796928 RepID=UPI001BD8BC77|nr:peptidoglycan binding domain-containing protein [Aerococcaceae bacterium zg-B36]
MKKTLLISSLTLLLLGVGYSAGIGYYAEKFQANTKFGTVDISNLTLEEALNKINADLSQSKIKVMENGKELGAFTLEELNGKVNAEEVLTAAYQSQDPSQWIKGYFSSEEYDNLLLNHVQIDDQDLTNALERLGINNAERQAAKDASIQYSDARGYYVEEAETGNQLDLEAVKEMIVNGLQTGEETIEVNTAYLKPQLTSEDEKITSTMQEIEKFASTKITLEISGESIVVPKEEILKWINFDESNHIVVDQDAAQAYVRTLNEKYATYDKVRQFSSTLQGTVSVQPGTLGWSIDSESEAAQLVADLKAGEDVTRTPAIVGSGYGSDGDDIGGTYVEIDMLNQMMYVYQNYEQVLSTAIVTGMSGSSDTIPGAYTIWNKERNAVLKGTRVQTGTHYEQPVDYWMPFDTTGQGIHDANWQSSFGGDAYLYSGSQGCINTPPEVMAVVFSIVEVGTPVIIF